MLSFAKAVASRGTSGGAGGRDGGGRGSGGLAKFNFQEIQLIGRGLGYQLAQDQAFRSSRTITRLVEDVEAAWLAGRMGYMLGKEEISSQEASP